MTPADAETAVLAAYAMTICGLSAVGRSARLPNFAPDRLGWLAWAATCAGTPLNFPDLAVTHSRARCDEDVRPGFVAHLERGTLGHLPVAILRLPLARHPLRLGEAKAISAAFLLGRR